MQAGQSSEILYVLCTFDDTIVLGPVRDVTDIIDSWGHGRCRALRRQLPDGRVVPLAIGEYDAMNELYHERRRARRRPQRGRKV